MLRCEENEVFSLGKARQFNISLRPHFNGVTIDKLYKLKVSILNDFTKDHLDIRVVVRAACLLHEPSMDQIQSDYDCALLILIRIEASNTEFSNIMLIFAHRELSAFNIFADGSEVKELEVVLKGYKETPSSTTSQPRFFLNSGIHLEDLSLQSPFHSCSPQGFLALMSLILFPSCSIS
jgi:hypothetical protein